jgi:hypothetical protein
MGAKIRPLVIAPGTMGWNVRRDRRYSVGMNATILLLANRFEFMAADTVVAIPVRDGFDVIAALTAGLIGATFLAILLTFLFVLFQVRNLARVADEARKRLASDRGVEHLRGAAANIEQISETLRDEVGKLSSSVTHLSDRLDQASYRMEERIEEFNALMEVVQAEAEDVFVDTASTARGVRRGVGRLADSRRDVPGRGRGSAGTARSASPGGPRPPSTQATPTTTPPAGDPLRRGPETSRTSTPDEEDESSIQTQEGKN